MILFLRNTDFISEYIPQTPGRFRDIEGYYKEDSSAKEKEAEDDIDEIKQEHMGMACYTIGQNAKISGASEK